MLRDMMDIEGYSSVGVSRADHVLEVARRQRPDLFLVDIMLPGTSGIEVAQALRADLFVHTPMIAMSASTTMLRVARNSGLFQRVVHKPFDLDVLFQYIQDLLPGARKVG